MLSIDVAHPRLAGEPIQVRVHAGTILGVYGPSGAGKTTWLRILAGFLPAVGSIVHERRELLADAPSRRPLTYVPQAPSVFPHLTVAQQVAASRPRGSASEVADLLASLDIAALAPRRGRTLSGGQAQRVVLARALHRQPPILLLDEPLSAVDQDTRQRSLGYLRQWARHHQAHVIWASHDWSEMERWADIVLVLVEGRAAGLGVPATLQREPPTAAAARLLGYHPHAGHWLHPARARWAGPARVTIRGAVSAVRPDGFGWRVTVIPSAPAGVDATDGPVEAYCGGAPPRLNEQVSIGFDTPSLEVSDDEPAGRQHSSPPKSARPVAE